MAPRQTKIASYCGAGCLSASWTEATQQRHENDRDVREREGGGREKERERKRWRVKIKDGQSTEGRSNDLSSFSVCERERVIVRERWQVSIRWRQRWRLLLLFRATENWPTFSPLLQTSSFEGGELECVSAAPARLQRCSKYERLAGIMLGVRREADGRAVSGAGTCSLKEKFWKEIKFDRIMGRAIMWWNHQRHYITRRTFHGNLARGSHIKNKVSTSWGHE